MYKKYTKEEKQELYEKLPVKNKSLFWDEGVNARISKIISRFSLTDSQSDELFEIIGNLFAGVLLPSYFSKAIEEKIPMENNNNLTQELIRFVIYPVNHILRDIYADEEFDKIGVKKNFSTEEKRKWHNEFGDTYREPVE